MEGDNGSRAAQRRRTHKAIVDAAARLMAARPDGGTPSVDEIAAEADVSRRTVYLHFPTLDQLLADATTGMISNAHVESTLASPTLGDDVVDRADALARAVLAQAAQTLPLGRRIIRLTVDNPPEPGKPTRGHRRFSWIEKAVEPLRGQLSTEQFDRLVSALALAIGWEPMIVLRDIRGLDAETEASVVTWAVKAMVEAMLAEAGIDPSQCGDDCA
jgi:AcrR family transcriptional regulator